MMVFTPTQFGGPSYELCHVNFHFAGARAVNNDATATSLVAADVMPASPAAPGSSLCQAIATSTVGSGSVGDGLLPQLKATEKKQAPTNTSKSKNFRIDYLPCFTGLFEVQFREYFVNEGESGHIAERRNLGIERSLNLPPLVGGNGTSSGRRHTGLPSPSHRRSHRVRYALLLGYFALYLPKEGSLPLLRF